MKTNVHCIVIEGKYSPAVVNIRTAEGNLKWHFLRTLLRRGQLIPSEQTNRLILELLEQMKMDRRAVRDTARDYYDLLMENGMLEDDLNDLQAEFAEYVATHPAEKSVH